MALTLTRTEGTTQEIRLQNEATPLQAREGTTDTTSDPLESPLTESLSQLNDLRQLEPNWDSYDGLPPTEEAITKASAFLSIVYEYLGSSTTLDVRPHRIAALPDSGIHLGWKRPQAETEVEFSPEGGLRFLYVEKQDGEDTSSIEEEDAPWWKALRLIEKTLLVYV